MAKRVKRIDATETDGVRQEWVRHLREVRDNLRGKWVRAMQAKGLLAGLSARKTENESIAIYDVCMECLDTGRFESAEAYARRTAEQGVLQGMTPVHPQTAGNLRMFLRKLRTKLADVGEFPVVIVQKSGVHQLSPN